MKATEAVFIERCPAIDIVMPHITEYTKALSLGRISNSPAAGLSGGIQLTDAEREECNKWYGFVRLETWARIPGGKAWSLIDRNLPLFDYVHHVMRWWLVGREFEISNDVAKGILRFANNTEPVAANIPTCGILMLFEGIFNQSADQAAALNAHA